MTDTITDWTKPVELDDVDVAFPANALEYMPPRDECEAALDAMEDRGEKWRAFQRKWFFRGLPETTEVDLKDGIDGPTAFRHLSAIQGSFAPKHEHKEAAVAYLASLWFDDVRYGD